MVYGGFMETELYSGRGAYVVLRPQSWVFAHDLLPHSWWRASGTGLTCWLRPWARLPREAVWVPTARSVGNPWRYDAVGPDPERILPRDENGNRLVLVGPVRCEWAQAKHEFRLLRGDAAVEAAQASVRANMLARLLLSRGSPIAVGAFDARIAISELDWEASEGGRLSARTKDGRILIADGDWVAAGDELFETIAALEAAKGSKGDE
jgi:hypothetical protein